MLPELHNHRLEPNYSRGNGLLLPSCLGGQEGGRSSALAPHGLMRDRRHLPIVLMSELGSVAVPANRDPAGSYAGRVYKPPRSLHEGKEARSWLPMDSLQLLRDGVVPIVHVLGPLDDHDLRGRVRSSRRLLELQRLHVLLDGLGLEELGHQIGQVGVRPDLHKP